MNRNKIYVYFTSTGPAGIDDEKSDGRVWLEKMVLPRLLKWATPVSFTFAAIYIRLRIFLQLSFINNKYW